MAEISFFLLRRKNKPSGGDLRHLVGQKSGPFIFAYGNWACRRQQGLLLLAHNGGLVGRKARRATPVLGAAARGRFGLCRYWCRAKHKGHAAHKARPVVCHGIAGVARLAVTQLTRTRGKHGRVAFGQGRGSLGCAGQQRGG